MEIIQKEKESVDFVSDSGVVNINRFATDLKGVRDLNELKALEIFSHFGADEENDANIVLLGSMPLGGTPSIEFVIDHVNGIESVACGVLNQYNETPTVGIAWDYSTNPEGDPFLKLTPADSWFTTPFNARLTGHSCNSNVIVGDMPPPIARVFAILEKGGRVSNTGATTGTFGVIAFANSSAFGINADQGSIVAGVGLPGDIAIGAPGTMYFNDDVTVDSNIGPNEINPSWENDFFIFRVTVPAAAITKTYRFMCSLNYI